MIIATILRRSALVLLLLYTAAPGASAQATEDCDLGTASADLDVNGVRARLFNSGNLFYKGGTPLYEVPRGSGISPIFAAGIWIGGLVGGEIRTAAATYAQGTEDYEYWPGPLGDDGGAPKDCDLYDRIWTVGQTDLARYEQSGLVTDDLAEWPADLGAPFFDVDGDGRYSLDAGDRPAISGTEMAWWVMNDAGGLHRTTLSPPIGLEVRASAFAVASSEPALTHATFYRYELTYRGTGDEPAPLDSAYFTFWVDPDLGNFSDDYIGSDTTRNLGFVYNADNDDEASAGGYGEAPPAQGIRWLKTPDDLGMTVFAYYNSNSDPRNGNPDTDVHYYNFMRGHWRDGSPVTYGLEGLDLSGVPTTFVYTNSGSLEDPVPGYWSEVCPQPDCDHPIPPDDRRFHTSTGPFTMQPGETETVVFALVWARGESNFDSIQQMKAASDYVERAWRFGVLDPVAPESPVEPEPPAVLRLAGPSPNPFRDATSFRLTVPEGLGAVRVAAYDVLGREVAVLADGALPPGEHTLTLEGKRLPAGVYLVRFEVDAATETLKVLHLD